MDIERKREIDEILMKTEEEMKREDFDPMKAGISLDEFLKIQKRKREIRHQKFIDYLLKEDEKLEERTQNYDQEKEYEGFLDINIEQ